LDEHRRFDEWAVFGGAVENFDGGVVGEGHSGGV
jgi:hypothetical protein